MQTIATVVLALFVSAAAVVANVLPGECPISVSTGFHDCATVTFGYPYIYRVGTRITPQSIGAPSSGAEARESTLWYHAGALAFNVAVGLLGAIGAVAVGRRVGRVVRAKSFTLADLFLVVLAAAAACGIAMLQRRYCEIDYLLGFDLDSPRWTSAIWYPLWIRAGMLVGMACGVVGVWMAVAKLTGKVLQHGGVPEVPKA